MTKPRMCAAFAEADARTRTGDPSLRATPRPETSRHSRVARAPFTPARADDPTSDDVGVLAGKPLMFPPRSSRGGAVSGTAVVGARSRRGVAPAQAHALGGRHRDARVGDAITR